MQWDVFCRVVDNFGDIGVCWRLAADLGSRGQAVRLWVDDPRALAWMAPRGAQGVQVVPWTDAPPELEPGDAVVEAFGCELPQPFVRRMAARSPPPAWINLEYLSAESYVERSHGLPSPQLQGAGKGLRKWFFYPGFTPATGGLLREPGLLSARRDFDRSAWLRTQGIDARPGDRLVSLFSYDNEALPDLLSALPAAPTLLLVAASAAPLLPALPDSVRVQHLAPLPQPEFDRLLWSCDLNLVRGEDSFVRAQWAGVPFVWQIYRQDDGAHHHKLAAFLQRFVAAWPEPQAAALRAVWRLWNGAPSALPEAPALDAWRGHCEAWSAELAGQPDLATQLLGFVAEKR
jgi:uncharacterized repeat protein (TIGR03837 family)